MMASIRRTGQSCSGAFVLDASASPANDAAAFGMPDQRPQQLPLPAIWIGGHGTVP